MTANAFMSASLIPPLIVVSIQARARLHGALRAATGYGVSVLSESLELEARRFAGMPMPDKYPDPLFAWRAGVPVLEHALTWFATTIVDTHAIGDHTLFVGEVVEFGAPNAEQPPLAFHASKFARVVPASNRVVPIGPWGSGEDVWG
jgi:flavin reductase (DIM6/NTAB) family NADH-FMN oxidoreductase RutF